MKEIQHNTSEQVQHAREEILKLFKVCEIPDNEFLQNIHLFLGPMVLKKLLFLNELYQKAMGIQGSIIEFGVRWGPNMAIFHALRTLYEPFNYARRIIGFDTFEGFPSVHQKDGKGHLIGEGELSVTPGYEEYLAEILQAREQEAPVSNLNKFELVKGDVLNSLPDYLDKHGEMIISLAYFDLDIYSPTLHCLEQIKDRLSLGSILAFDELNLDQFPGETEAVREFFAGKARIHRSPHSQNQAYIIWGER